MAVLTRFPMYQLIRGKAFSYLVHTCSVTKLCSQQIEILATVSCKCPLSFAVHSEFCKLFIKVYKEKVALCRKYVKGAVSERADETGV